VLSRAEKKQVEGQTYCEVFSLFKESFILSPSTHIKRLQNELHNNTLKATIILSTVTPKQTGEG
jgi:hypothetical protein